MHPTNISVALAAMLLIASGLAMAQTAPAGPGRGMGPGAGRDFTHGWSMMSRAERDEHRKRMAEARTPEACHAARDEHRKQMEQRARERGMKSLPQPRRDACAGMRG